MKRPFWLHQVVDYILGILVMAQATKADAPKRTALAEPSPADGAPPRQS